MEEFTADRMSPVLDLVHDVAFAMKNGFDLELAMQLIKVSYSLFFRADIAQKEGGDILAACKGVSRRPLIVLQARGYLLCLTSQCGDLSSITIYNSIHGLKDSL